MKIKRLVTEARIYVAIGICLALVGLGIIGTELVRRANAQPTLSLPFASSVAVTTSSTPLVGVNPSRRAIQFCFPAVAASITIAPSPITPVSLTTGIATTLTATPAQPVCYTSPTLTASGTSGGAGNSWNAIASAGTINVTVMEW